VGPREYVPFVRLLYKPTTFDGQPTPPPQRDTAEPAIAAITQAVRGRQRHQGDHRPV
jgi:hypothetical protein